MEETIKFETAKLAEEKGYKFEYIGGTLVSVPIQSVLQRWLRCEHDIHIAILYTGEFDEDFDYHYEILYFQGNEKNKYLNAKRITYTDNHGCASYEIALEKALFKSLELI
jgi:hypothetical protein